MSPYGFPGDFGQRAEDSYDQAEIERQMRLMFPDGPPRPASRPASPGVKLGPISLSGEGVDSASLALLQALQNSPQPRGFVGGLASGLAQGYAGARGRQAKQREDDFEVERKRVADEEDDRRRARREAAATLANHKWQMAREAAEAKNKPASSQGKRYPLTPKLRQQLKNAGVFVADDATDVPESAVIRDMPMRAAISASPEDEARLDRVVEGVVRGDLSPDLGDYGRDSRVRLALSDKLMQRGVNLVRMTQKYNAEKTFLRSANGTIALRGMRNVVNARESLDYAEQLLNDSIGKIPRGRITMFNRASMFAAAEGAFGPEAAASARQLKAQVAAIRFELSNIYMGGTAPTDQAVRKAMDVIDSNWSEEGLRGAIALARRDLGIRVNAINEVGPISLDEKGGVVGAPQPTNAPKPEPDSLKGNVSGAAFLKGWSDSRTGKKKKP